MLNSCSHSQSGIPNNAGPFSGTTKITSMLSLIMVMFYMSICGMQELLWCTWLSLSLWTCLTHLHWYIERVFCSYWWVLSCHHYMCILYLHGSVLCLLFVFWILQLLLIWCCRYWKLLIQPWHIHVLQPWFTVLVCVMNCSGSFSPVIFAICLLWLLHSHLKWFALPHLEQLFP